MQRLREITYADAKSLTEHLAEKYGFVVKLKQDSDVMDIVGSLLDTFGIVKKGDFDQNFCTTLGNRMYLQFAPGSDVGGWSPAEQIMVVVHEATHVVQFSKGDIPYVCMYLLSTTDRARFEAEAYAAGSAIYYACTGTVLSGDQVRNDMRSYGVSGGDMEMVKKIIDTNNSIVQRGGVPSAVAREAIDWMRTQGIFAD